MARDSWTIHRFATVGSTQAVAADLVARGTPHCTVVVAERQTAGYGRKGDVWQDVPGSSLLMTVIVRSTHHASMPHYAMIAALACIEAIQTASCIPARIKWPNDVLMNGYKVAGILGDATWRGVTLEALRIGVGMNITGDRNSFIARGLPQASSVAAEVGHDVDREIIFGAFLSAFSRWEDTLSEGNTKITAAWRASVVTVGQVIIATGMDGRDITGRATGVTDDGDLLVATEAGQETRLRATEVRALRHAE